MKEHPEYKQYFVTEDGKIFSAKRQRLIEVSCHTNKFTGYLQTKLMFNGKRITVYPHRLVAETYLPNPSEKSSVNHIDGDKMNNSLNNLEWVTHLENMQHAIENGLWNPNASRRRLDA